MKRSYIHIGSLLAILLVSTAMLYIAESNAIELIWPSDQSGSQANNRLYMAKSLFLTEEEFFETEGIIKALSGVSPSKPLFNAIINSEDYLSQIKQMFKLLSISEQYLIEGVRAVLAQKIINDSSEDETSRALTLLFGNWSPFLHQVWYSAATSGGDTLEMLFRQHPDTVYRVQTFCQELGSQHKILACRAAVLMHIDKDDYYTMFLKDRLKVSLINLAQFYPVRKCPPFYWVNKFLNQEDLFLPDYFKSESMTINFIWVGPNMPMKYANNLMAWKEGNPQSDVVLWYLPELLSSEEIKSMAALESYAGVEVKSLLEANFSYLGEAGQAKVYELISSIQATSSKKKFAAVSDTMRIALSGHLSEDNNIPVKSYVYLDLDIEFESTCGFLHPSQWHDNVAFHLSPGKNWCDDIVAIRDGQYAGIFDFIMSRVMVPGSTLTGSRLFGNLISDGMGEKRAFPLLWNKHFNDLSYIHNEMRDDLKNTWHDFYWNRHR